MSKETKEMLKTIITGQELIMKHLKIAKPAEAKKAKKSEPKAAPAKKVQSKSK